MNKSIKTLAALLIWAAVSNSIAAQQFSINSAGGCFEPEAGTVKTNFWMFGELLTGVDEGEITSYNGFIPFAILENFTALGIEEEELIEQLKAYPVPSFGWVDLTLSAKENMEVRKELYDMKGQLLASEDVNLTVGNNYLKLNLSDFPSGNYLLRLTSDQGTMAVTRVMKH